VRLKGGDPFVFGRGGEECLALRAAGCAFEVVPGITAGIAAPCYAGIPITQRGDASSMALITGHEDPTKETSSIQWKHLAKGVDTLVFYMGVKNLPEIVSRLMEAGRSGETPVALVRWGTRPEQKTVTGTLSTITEIVQREGLKPPAITVVGDVVRHRENLTWFETKPLFGRCIINTRSRSQASELTTALRALGAGVVELPTIEIVPEGPGSELARAAQRAGEYDWVMFTSPNGVHAFFTQLLAAAGDVRALGSARIASIGPGTSKAAEKYHVKVDVTAEKAVAEGLVESLRGQGPWDGRKVLLPRAAAARDVLPEALKGWGANVHVVTAYTTVRPANVDDLILEDIVHGNYDLITFSSSSTFTNFVALMGTERFSRVRQGLRAASIGQVTSAGMRAEGVEPKVEAKTHTIPGLVEAIVRYSAPGG
jgi:uroporphyrinogen III methyltransferase/synthase